MTNNHAVLDFNKVQFATFYYRNQFGQVSRKRKRWSVNNVSFNPKDSAYMIFGEPCTLGELAKANGVLDIWTPIVRFQLTANHSIKYTGNKAIEMWKHYRAKIFKQT